MAGMPAIAGEGAASSDAHTRFLSARTFKSLDGLRAAAILGVVWHHAYMPKIPLRIADRGFLGVDLFFIISGFLIVTLMLRERRRTGRISLKAFYVRRALRIFPAYYAMLLVVGAAALLRRGTHSDVIVRDLPFAACYLSNMVPMQSLLSITWSLSVEEQFYLLVPTLEKIWNATLPIVFPVGYVLVSLPPFGLFPALDVPLFFRQTTFGPILLGVMLAHVLNHPRGFEWVARLLGARWASIAALVLVVLAMSHPAEDISGWPRLTIHWALLALVASCVVREDHVLAPALSCWPFRRIGIVSYGIYLYHIVVMHVVVAAAALLGTTSSVFRVTGTALASWVAAEFSYRAFESRFLSLKSRFAPAERADAPAPRAVLTPAREVSSLPNP
jgi:peptidoglycan/LPS O-acetylase OafA/YrhL